MIGGSNPSSGWQFLSSPLGPTHLPIQWVSGSVSLGVKWHGHEADHSPPYSAKVKNAWSYTSTPQYAFIAWCSVKKHRDNFTYTCQTLVSSDEQLLATVYSLHSCTELLYSVFATI
jgi:hypothetical protein